MIKAKSKYLQFTSENFRKSNSFYSIREEFIKQCPKVNRNYNKAFFDDLKVKIDYAREGYLTDLWAKEGKLRIY